MAESSARFPPSPRLPAELCDVIIDFCYDDRQTLLVLSQVSRDCMKRARSHLFETISLDTDQTADERDVDVDDAPPPNLKLEQLLPLLNAGSESIAGAIRSLILAVQPPFSQCHELMDTLRSKNARLTFLSLSFGLLIDGPEWLSPFTSQSHLYTSFSEIATLQVMWAVTDPETDDDRQIIVFLSQFLCLETLQLGLRGTSRTVYSNLPVLQSAKTLRTLNFGGQHGYVFDWLCNQAGMALLQMSMVFRNILEGSNTPRLRPLDPHARKLITVQSENLASLALELEHLHDLALPSFPQLDTLCLRVGVLKRTELVEVVVLIDAPQLRRLILSSAEGTADPEAILARKDVPWMDLAFHFCAGLLPSLSEITFGFQPDADAKPQPCDRILLFRGRVDVLNTGTFVMQYMGDEEPLVRLAGRWSGNVFMPLWDITSAE